MSKASETATAKAAPPPAAETDAADKAADPAAETGTTEAPRVAVTFLRPHPAYGYFAGDATELPADVADALIESKHVEKAK